MSLDDILPPKTRESEDRPIRDPMPRVPAGMDPEAPYGRKADGTPKKRPGRPKGSAGGSTSTRRSDTKLQRTKERSEYLKTVLGRQLAFPAMPAAMLPVDAATRAYLVTHFSEVGPYTADMLVEASETSDRLREILEKACSGSTTVTIASALAVYVGAPVLWVVGMNNAALSATQGAIFESHEARKAGSGMEAVSTAMQQMMETAQVASQKRPPPQQQEQDAQMQAESERVDIGEADDFANDGAEPETS